MKKLWIAVASVALAAGCAVQEIDHSSGVSSRSVLFTASETATRTAFDAPVGTSYPTLWTDNDSEVLLSLNFEESQSVPVVPSPTYKTATFSATFPERSSYTFYALSPASASSGMSPSRKSWKVTIPSEQTPLSGSCDERAQILVASSSALTEAPAALDLYFSHLTSYMSMTLSNLPDGVVVTGVEVTSSVPFVGEYYYDCTSKKLEGNGESCTVTLTTDGQGPVWLACAPVDMSGATLTVSVSTPEGKYVQQKTFPEGRVLTPGKIALFTVDFSGVEPEVASTEEYYELVTDASTLSEGDEVIIATPQYNRALSTTQNTNNRGNVGVTIDGDRIYDPAATVQVLTLEGSVGAWYFKVSDGQYLYTTSSTNNSRQYLRTGTKNQSSVYNVWSVSVANGNATIAAKVDNSTTKYLVYNNSSSVFAVATSAPGTGNNRVALYRKVTTSSSGDDAPVLAYEEYGAYLTSSSWVYVAATDHLSREYGENDLTFAILSPFKNAVMEFQGIPQALSKGTGFTLQFRRQEDQKVDADDSYEVTVVKESGRKVWLSDSRGNGFIVKK